MFKKNNKRFRSISRLNERYYNINNVSKNVVDIVKIIII